MAQNSPAVSIGTGAAGQVIADIAKEGVFAPIWKSLEAITQMKRNKQSMLYNRDRLKMLSQAISTEIRDSENPAHSEMLQQYLRRMIELIKKADSLNLAQPEWGISNIIFSRQIPELAAEEDKLLNDLSIDIGIAANSRRLSEQPEGRVVLLHPLPDGGFVGEAIKTAETKLKMWISMQLGQVKSILVYGSRGVGKTSLLQIVYNFYNVSNVFEKVIWLTVSKDYKIGDLQKRIGQQIGLDLSNTDEMVGKMQLFANLKYKKFLLILDDLSCALDLKQLGVAFETDRGSKVVFSSNSDFELTEDQESMEVELLTTEDSWLLFERVAFKGSNAPGEIIEFAKNIAEKCRGLPLAIIVVAKAMRPKKTLAEWEVSWPEIEQSLLSQAIASLAS